MILESTWNHWKERSIIYGDLSNFFHLSINNSVISCTFSGLQCRISFKWERGKGIRGNSFHSVYIPCCSRIGSWCQDEVRLSIIPYSSLFPLSDVKGILIHLPPPYIYPAEMTLSNFVTKVMKLKQKMEELNSFSCYCILRKEEWEELLLLIQLKIR